MTQESPVVETTVEDQILTITINRPKALNALNNQVLDELTEIVANIDSDTRCVVLRGSGQKAFVAGADISEMKNMNADEAGQFSRKGQLLTESIESLPQPTFAFVDGFALGGGCEMAMACDIILATEKAKFGQPEVHLGLIPGFGGTKRLIRRMGYSKSMELLLTGRPISGKEAFENGLVAVCKPDEAELEMELSKMIKGVLKAGPNAVAMTKSLAQKSNEEPLSDGLKNEAAQFSVCFENGEGEEGMSAFLEKRPAKFS